MFFWILTVVYILSVFCIGLVFCVVSIVWTVPDNFSSLSGKVWEALVILAVIFKNVPTN